MFELQRIFPTVDLSGKNQLLSSGSVFSQPKSTAEKTQLRWSDREAGGGMP